MTPHPIPWYYRVPLLYVEPPMALVGALMLFNSPYDFLNTMSPRASRSSTVAASLSEVRVLTDQLAILLLVFTFNLAVVLRVTRDPVVWRVACAGMLMSDVLHTTASARELGWATAGAPRLWRWEDWVNFGVLGGMGLVRLGVVLGVGLGGEGRTGGLGGGKVKRG